MKQFARSSEHFKPGRPGSLQISLRLSYEAAIGLEYISEHRGRPLDKRYHCNLCNVSHHPSAMYNHIISTDHRRKYLLQKKSLSPMTSVTECAKEYERKHGRQIQQIKVFDQSGKIFSKARVAVHKIKYRKVKSRKQKKMKSQKSTNLNAIDSTSRCSDHHRLEQPSSSTCVPHCSYDGLLQLPESNDTTTNFHGQFEQYKKTLLTSEEYSDGRNLIVNATTPNAIAGTVQNEVWANLETAHCSSDILYDEDAESVITVSSSGSSVNMLCLSDMEEEENDQTTNYNFNSSYDVVRRTDKHIDSVGSFHCNWNPTKMECLQVFMEQTEPLVIETQSRYAFVVSIIQAVCEALEKCNVQNLPP